ncbi:31821_t:CDS:2, partial [Racocetra persica]
YHKQTFNVTAAQTSSSLLALTMISLVVPAAYSSTTGSSKAAVEGTHKDLYEDVGNKVIEKPKTTLFVSITAQ